MQCCVPVRIKVFPHHVVSPLCECHVFSLSIGRKTVALIGLVYLDAPLQMHPINQPLCIHHKSRCVFLGLTLGIQRHDVATLRIKDA
mgnify:CR=1 FL=1